LFVFNQVRFFLDTSIDIFIASSLRRNHFVRKSMGFFSIPCKPVYEI